jgi:hypothetical protein
MLPSFNQNRVLRRSFSADAITSAMHYFGLEPSNCAQSFAISDQDTSLEFIRCKHRVWLLIALPLQLMPTAWLVFPPRIAARQHERDASLDALLTAILQIENFAG